MQKTTTNKAQSKGVNAGRSAQDRFLLQMSTEHRKVTVFLINGIKLEGQIASFDEHVILLKGEMTDHVYKHAVSTIQPATEAAARTRRGAGSAPARVATRFAARLQPEFAPAATRREGAAPDAPRQPVVVIRTRRRSIKSSDDQG